jgi:hypothetical protein
MLAPAPEARWPRLGDALAVLLRHAGSELAQQKELRRRLAPNAPDDTAGARSVQSPAQPRAVPPRERPTARQLRTVSAAAPAPRYVAASELCEIELPFRGDDALAARPEPPAAPHERRGGGRPRAAGSLGRRRRVAGVTAAGLAVAAMLAGVAAAARAPRGRGAAPAPTARTLAAVPPPSHRRTADGPTPAPDGGSGGAPLPAGEAAGALDPADVVRVVVEGAADSLAVGDSVRLRAALVDGRGVPRPEGEATAARIRWRSADTSRVQVSPAGWARATRAGGPVTVTAQVGSARGRRRLRVVPASGARVAAGPEWTTDLAAPAGPSTAEAESLVETFVAALRGRDVAVVGRLLEAGGAASAAEVTRWLRERRAFGAALVERGALHADGDAFAMDFRVTLSWKTRTLTDLHRGGTAHATSRTFRATLARDAAGWGLRGVTPVEPFPP